MLEIISNAIANVWLQSIQQPHHVDRVANRSNGAVRKQLLKSFTILAIAWLAYETHCRLEGNEAKDARSIVR